MIYNLNKKLPPLPRVSWYNYSRGDKQLRRQCFPLFKVSLAPGEGLSPKPKFWNVFFVSLILACVAGAWQYWAKERTGAREGDTRVSFSRARFFLCPLLPSACYTGYIILFTLYFAFKLFIYWPWPQLFKRWITRLILRLWETAHLPLT